MRAPSDVLRQVIAVLLVLVLTISIGCPAGSRSSPPGPTSTGTLPTFTTEKAILVADATTSPVQSALAALALDRTKLASLRYTALRKLEEQAPSVVVPVAEQLGEVSTLSKDDDFLRLNAVGVLFRQKTPDGQAALDRVKKSSIAAGVLAARLEREGK